MSENDPFVFISYSHSDTDFAIKFSKRLTKAGIPHFRDVVSINWGESIPSRVREGLESATHLVVLISPGSAESPWVAYEMGYAHGKNVTLVPYLLHPRMSVPGFIANLRHIKSLKDETNFVKSLKKESLSNATGPNTADPADNQRVSIEIYSGHHELIVSDDTIDRFYDQSSISEIKLDNEGYPSCNSFISLISNSNPSHSAIGRISTDTGTMIPVLKVGKDGIWSLFPRNREQAFALDLLINDDVRIVSLFGSNHSRKRLLALAAGLHEVVEKNKYNRLIISRPIIGLIASESKLFEDSGLSVWMQPYFDNFEILLSGQENENRKSKGYRELMQMGILDIEPLSGIFGRCIEEAFIIVDDVQLLTRKELQELFAAVSEGSRLILLSDISPTNSHSLSYKQCEIINIVNRLKGRKGFGHISLSRSDSESLIDIIGDLLL